MSESVYHPTTPQLAKHRKELAPAIHDAFENFSRTWRLADALPEKKLKPKPKPKKIAKPAGIKAPARKPAAAKIPAKKA